jgi:hypothetical protein
MRITGVPSRGVRSAGALFLGPSRCVSPEGLAGQPRLVFHQQPHPNFPAWAPGGATGLGGSRCPAGKLYRRGRQSSALGAHGCGDDCRRDWLLLGSSLEPRDPAAVEIPCGSSQRDPCEFSRQHAGPSGRHGVHAAVRPGVALRCGPRLAGGAESDPGACPVLFIGSLWSYFIHANVRWRLGPLEEIISSPAFHHWRHTFEDHKDHNYASMLPVMDRVFGTFYLPKAWPADYGAATPIPVTLVGQILDPFAPGASEAKVSSPKGSTPSLSEQPRPF